MPDRPFDPGFNPFEELVKTLVGGLEQTLGGTEPGPARTTATPRLNRHGRDLTEAAKDGRLDPVIGRDAEVEQVLEVLCRRTKNNPVLIGDPGVGKTAIVEGIAARLASGDVPAGLRDRRMVALDLAGMVAGTKYRGEFEERLTDVIDEVVAADRSVLLFLDELHTVVGAGAAEGGAMDAGSMLKPALARGGLQLIGATTVDEYRRHIERDPALERRFQPILVGEPGVADTVAILRGLRERYQEHHGVRISDEATEAAARLAERYLTDRYLPDKAIDLMDRASARVALRGASEVDAADIAEVVARTTGIPVARLTEADRQRLLHLEDVLRERVVGQDDAVLAVADAVRAGRAGLTHPGRPVGSFLFLGPTGVGKTELARALAEALFGGADRMIRFDMSEFQDRHTVSRLVGAPPGYVGHDEPGQLTEVVRRSPYSVLLLDEIEKAHPDVTGLLLQVLDAGRLTDARGRTVNFTNTVIIMTSNVAAEAMLAAGAVPNWSDEMRETLLAGLRTRFRPEFLNRIDEVVPFRPLGRSELRAITELLLAETREQLAAQDVGLSLDTAAVDWLVDRGHRPESGARPLRRTIGRELDRRLSRMLLAGELRAGQVVRATVVEDRLELGVNDDA
ncbi:hypothetical protein GCM10023321_23750 [Pseudonocardia eucalypti]|uniref:ATP-dependent Clp protease ATP-binding subunit ClpC n=1 Tax=Pseudonocardia eucalypti TaxID=648755 RepID=A0ABP9PYA0_9PSEU|nr:ATP-dependent Clp protease ATP-binding subunit ClpC [Pseudonocardia eucalypti]